MVTYQKIITINRPNKEVFEYVSNLQNGPQWQPELLEAWSTTKGPLGIGTQYTSIRKIMGQKIEATVEFVTYEPNKKYVIKSISGPLPFEQTSLFEATAGGTKVTTTIDLHPGGDMAQAEPMLAKSLKQEMDADFDNLKKLLEKNITPVVA